MLTTVCSRFRGVTAMRAIGNPFSFRFSSTTATDTPGASKKVSPPPKSEEVTELEKKKKQLTILAQALSDSEDKLKKTQEEMKELKEFGNMKFAKEMLEVMDNIEQLQGFMLVKLILEATQKAQLKKQADKKSSAATATAEPPKVVITGSPNNVPKKAKDEKAAKSKEDDKKNPKMSDTEQMCSALNIIAKDFAIRLSRQGITPIPDPIGKKFDSRYHNAVVELAKSAVDGGGRMTALPPQTASGDFTVMQVMKRGYMYKGRLLRPANVAVSRDGQKKSKK